MKAIIRGSYTAKLEVSVLEDAKVETFSEDAALAALNAFFGGSDVSVLLTEHETNSVGYAYLRPDEVIAALKALLPNLGYRLVSVSDSPEVI